MDFFRVFSHRHIWAPSIVLIAVLISISTQSFILFHTMAELFSIMVAVLMYVVAWQTYRFSRNAFYMFLASGYFWIAFLDVVHTFIYKGMNILPITDANPATQFWIVARYSEAILLLFAPVFLSRTIYRRTTFTGFGIVAGILYTLVMSGNFPDAFIEGQGLTQFKVISEYVIIMLLIGALTHLVLRRTLIENDMLLLIGASIALTIVAEFCFTKYVSVYGISNLVGHLFKFLSFWLLFIAIIRNSLLKPYIDLENEIVVHKQTEAELEEARNELLQRVEDRTQELRKSDTRFIDAIESMPHMMVLFDSEDRYVISNKMYRETLSDIDDVLVPGMSLADILRVSCERGLVEGYQDKPEEWVQIRLARLHTPHEPILHQQRDGRWVLTADHKTSDGGTLIHRADVSEIMRTQEHLQKAKEMAEMANRSKSVFLANMSHELRTPLNAIIGFSESMKEETFGTVGSDKNREYINDIHYSGLHLLELINDILDVSAIEVDALELYEENISLTDVVNATIRLIKPQADKAQITVTSSTDPAILQICVDERRVKQILLNLLSNAVKFTPEGGKVSLNARLNTDGSLALMVSDTGIGMTEEETVIALSMFGQVDNGLGRRHEGTGLGLPLTKGLVELHGGTLEIESLKDKGTTVTAIFPKERVIQNV